MTMYCIERISQKIMNLNELENIKEAEQLANRFLLECEREKTYLHTDVNGIYTSFIYPEYGEYELCYANIYEKNDEGERWALTDCKKHKIVLDFSLQGQNKSRYAFTLAHEIRHVIDFYTGVVPHPKYLTPKERLVIERRADVFATHLLMPAAFVLQKFREKFGDCYPIKFYGPGNYWCNGRLRYNIQNASDLNAYYARELQAYFSHVSIASLSIRLQELRLLPRATDENFTSFSFLEQKDRERKNDLLHLISTWQEAQQKHSSETLKSQLIKV